MNAQTLVALIQRLVTPQDQTQFQQDEASIAEFAQQPGFGVCLELITRPQSVQLRDDVRHLATIILKNLISDSWEGVRGKKKLEDGEKAELKQTILAAVPYEKNIQIAKMRALTLAEIARHDLTTNNWPNLIPELIASSETDPISRQTSNTADILQARL
ncbi:MAG: hypothetical protein EZS28_049443, partial [Streblomastix strix]